MPVFVAKEGHEAALQEALVGLVADWTEIFQDDGKI